MSRASDSTARLDWLGLPVEILKEVLSFVAKPSFIGGFTSNESRYNNEEIRAEMGLLEYRLVSVLFSSLCLELIEEIDFNPGLHDISSYGKGFRYLEARDCDIILVSILLARPVNLKIINNLFIFEKNLDKLLIYLRNCTQLIHFDGYIDCQYPFGGEENLFNYNLTEDIVKSYLIEKLDILNATFPLLKVIDLMVFNSHFMKEDGFFWSFAIGTCSTYFFSSRRDFQILVNTLKNEAFCDQIRCRFPALRSLIINDITILPLSERGQSRVLHHNDADSNGYLNEFDAAEDIFKDFSIPDWPYYNMKLDRGKRLFDGEALDNLNYEL